MADRITAQRLAFLHQGTLFTSRQLLVFLVVVTSLTLYNWRLGLAALLLAVLWWLRHRINGYLKATLFGEAYLTVRDSGGRRVLVEIHPRGNLRVLDGTLRLSVVPGPVSTTAAAGAVQLSVNSLPPKTAVPIIDSLLPDTESSTHHLMLDKPTLPEMAGARWTLDYRHRPGYWFPLRTRWLLTLTEAPR